MEIPWQKETLLQGRGQMVESCVEIGGLSDCNPAISFMKNL